MGKRSKPKEGYFDSYPTKQSDEPLGLWETDPAAWDAKPAFEKAWSAWSGEPGMMFWMNKGSYWGPAFWRSCGCCSGSSAPRSGCTSSTGASSTEQKLNRAALPSRADADPEGADVSKQRKGSYV